VAPLVVERDDRSTAERLRDDLLRTVRAPSPSYETLVVDVELPSTPSADWLAGYEAGFESGVATANQAALTPHTRITLDMTLPPEEEVTAPYPTIDAALIELEEEDT
jgi:hypothetical protein